VDNFKGFASPQEARLGPLTLIFGPNSAGKSALVHALLSLSQSLPSQAAGYYEEAPPSIRWTGRCVDLGGFANVVNQHDLSLRIGLGVSRVDPQQEGADELSLDMWIRWNEENQIAVVEEFRYRVEGDHDSDFWLKSDPGVFVEYRGDSDAPERHPAVQWVVDEDRTDVTRMAELIREQAQVIGQSALEEMDRASSDGSLEETLAQVISGRPYGARGFLPLVAYAVSDSGEAVTPTAFYAGHNWAGIVARRGLGHWLDLRFLKHIGPLREPPKRAQVRLEPSAGRNGRYVGSTGGAMIDVFLANEEALGHANYWLGRLGLRYSVEPRTLEISDAPSAGSWVTLLLTDTSTGVSVALSDVGVGVSQVLPIVAQLALGSNDTVLLEQPELHLHPKAQADLGDLLVESVGLGKQVIAETHSEHLLLRVLRRIRQGTLAPGDVSVLYVDAGDSGSSVQELRLDSRGEFLDEWPNGFFEERIDELFD
jgi:predicted ATPase